MQSKKRKLRWHQTGLARGLGVGILILLLALPAALPNMLTPSSIILTSTPIDDLARPLPVVPAGGTPILPTGTYFHRTGIFSLPKLQDWELPAQTPEELVSPVGNSTRMRAGTMFSNSNAASVIHAFVETDSQVKFASLDDLDLYYTPEILNGAWAHYSSWRETGRQRQNDQFVINFELKFEESTYLGRQISRLQQIGEQTWLMVMRLVVPSNNPELLERLQFILLPQYRMWTESLSTPLEWNTISTSGYLIRYPLDWRRADGSVGRPYTLQGKMGAQSVTLVTMGQPGTLLTGEESARVWVTQNIARSEIKTIQTVNRTNAFGEGYFISYTSSDADGNARSGAVMLLNGADGAVYSANLQIAGSTRDLLAESGISADIQEIFESFTVTAFAQENRAAPTATPTNTP